MLIRLTGKRWVESAYHKCECDVADSACAKRFCLSPHDFGYRLANGVYKKSLRCLTRERGGCK